MTTVDLGKVRDEKDNPDRKRQDIQTLDLPLSNKKRSDPYVADKAWNEKMKTEMEASGDKKLRSKLSKLYPSQEKKK